MWLQVHADVLDGMPVAIKILKPTLVDRVAAVKGLKREIMLMTLMDHPNVLQARSPRDLAAISPESPLVP